MTSAFSTIEQGAILSTSVDNSKSQGYSGWSTDGGNNTQDRVFLLSYAEAHQYFAIEHYSYYIDSSGNYNYTNVTSRIRPTAYAIKNCAYTSNDYKNSEGTAAGWWWLRSPGNFRNRATYVGSDGSLDSYHDVGNASGCVRPALWINLESDIF